MDEIPSNELVEPLILTIRGHRVVLDTDLARVYGVRTKAFNQAFKRNQSRFPADFAFQLTQAEFDDLRSQSVTANAQAPDLNESNWSQTVTSSRRHRGAIYRPWVFTEHGALMAANILRSERAVK